MRFYSCFTLLVCLNWSWQPKRVWCKLLLLRNVNCRPTTFHSTTTLQSSANYCNSKVTTFIFWRFPSQTHTGYQRSGSMEGFLSTTTQMLRYFQIKTTIGPFSTFHQQWFSHHIQCFISPSDETQSLSNPRITQAVLTLITNLTEWSKLKRVDKL
jgi:hypothetical protein